MFKTSLKNRKRQKIVVVIDQHQHAQGLAFVMHGLSGNKEQPHIVAIAQSFRDKNFTVVLFDTTNTYGESDGSYEEATITTYKEDLEDVIAWSKKQPWFVSPFYLVGHSLGGIASILYAQTHSDEVKALAPISTIISGKLSARSKFEEHGLQEWERTGWRSEQSSTSPTGFKKLPWSHMLDRFKYDVLPDAVKLTMPVLMIVGERDEGTPLAHQQILYDKLPGKKELHIIKDAPHTFRTEEQLTEIQKLFLQWIESVEHAK